MRVRARSIRVVLAVLIALVAALGASATTAQARPTARISGDGSSWAGNALADWVAAIKAQGVVVDFTPDGSSSGRTNFARGLSDFAVSEIPYTGDTSDPQDTARPNFGYGMLPVVSGGTSFMYNLPVNGQRFTGLKLTQSALAKIFAGEITMWNDARIKKTNPGVNLPAQRITVVVRSDGSGATAQFTLWMKRQFPKDYRALCAKSGCNPNNATSYYPYKGLKNFTAQSQSNGVTTYTANTPYTINYDEYSYALGVNFPVAQIQNRAGFYTVPTASAVAVALTQAKINTNKHSPNYLSQDLSNVYEYRDPRTYPISAYSYLIVPTQTHGNFNSSKGETLAYFSTFSLCEGQRTMGALGYSPLPMNLVLAAMNQVLRVPGVDSETRATIQSTQHGVKSGTSNPCNNPTFKPGDSPAHNVLIDTAPFPAGCDAACQSPWINKVTNVSGPGTTHVDNPGSTNTTGPSGSNNGSNPNPNPNNSSGNGSTDPGVPKSTQPKQCDPDTGVCTDAGGPLGTTDGATPAGAITASPSVLPGGSAWGGAQLALILSLCFAALLVLLPPIAARVLDRRATSERRTDQEHGP
jgi:phosphate transport system substrate-binding protein